MSCPPVQLGNLPNHQPVIYLADGTQSRSDIHYFHQPNTLLGCIRNISLSKHTWLQKWHREATAALGSVNIQGSGLCECGWGRPLSMIRFKINVEMFYLSLFLLILLKQKLKSSCLPQAGPNIRILSMLKRKNFGFLCPMSTIHWWKFYAIDSLFVRLMESCLIKKGFHKNCKYFKVHNCISCVSVSSVCEVFAAYYPGWKETLPTKLSNRFNIFAVVFAMIHKSLDSDNMLICNDDISCVLIHNQTKR